MLENRFRAIQQSADAAWDRIKTVEANEDDVKQAEELVRLTLEGCLEHIGIIRESPKQLVDIKPLILGRSWGKKVEIGKRMRLMWGRRFDAAEEDKELMKRYEYTIPGMPVREIGLPSTIDGQNFFITPFVDIEPAGITVHHKPMDVYMPEAKVSVHVNSESFSIPDALTDPTIIYPAIGRLLASATQRNYTFIRGRDYWR